MERVIRCPKCKGKGHVFDTLALANPFEWIIAPFEKDDPDAYSRERCDKCHGHGYICV